MKQDKNSVRLWVPKRAQQRSPQGKSQGFLDYVYIALSYRDLDGQEPSWQKLGEVIEPYSLQRIVDIVCRINAALYNAKVPQEPETQARICHGLFGEEAETVLAVADRLGQEMKREGNQAPIQLFYGTQTLTFLKAAFLLKPLTASDRAIDNVGIGKALLMITDLINGDPGNILNLEPSDPDYRDNWLQYILINSLSADRHVDQKAFARSYDLYLTDKPALVSCGSYLDLPATLHNVTSLDPKALWSAVFALVAHWATISVEKVGNTSVAINRSSYFSTHFRFSEEEVDRFFALVATDATTLQQEIQSKYTITDIKPFHILPFARWPLVTFGDQVYSVSVKLLMEKLTRGLHDVYLEQNPPWQQRERYLNYIGKIFEDYVEQIFARIYPPLSGRYVPLDKFRVNYLKRNQKYCDGLILYEDSVILVETKASLFTAEARSGLKVAQIKSRLRYIYVHAAEQIQQTISAIQAGSLSSEGISPQRISHFYPLVVTLESIPMTPILCAEIQRILQSKRLLASDGVKPLQFMDTGCLEEIEAIVSVGVTMKQLLDEKLSSQTEAEDSFTNFLYRRRDRWGDLQNDYMSKYYKTIAKEAREFFTNRRLTNEG